MESIHLSFNNLTHLDDSMFTFMDYQMKELRLTAHAITIVNLSRAIYLPQAMYLGYNKIVQFIA